MTIMHPDNRKYRLLERNENQAELIRRMGEREKKYRNRISYLKKKIVEQKFEMEKLIREKVGV